MAKPKMYGSVRQYIPNDTADQRKKLICLLVKVCPLPYKEIGKIADNLIENGLTFGACVPGPKEDNPNIMELCFHNGERNMKEKVMKFLEEL